MWKKNCLNEKNILIKKQHIRISQEILLKWYFFT